ncbi:MAG: GNAT family N-acetyltransferase [Actinophytocola sp.]|nr:GNAT family N-acetyltransferase [Actinophytocola sp.]
MTVREAVESDAELLLTWRNDPETLKWSRGHQVVAEPVHRTWLRKSMTDPNRLLLVIESDHPVGTVRFDRADEVTWEVSITVAPGDRGRGLASRILAMGEGALRARETPATILANVHEDNTASRALFDRAGYTETNRPTDGPFRWLAEHAPD